MSERPEIQTGYQAMPSATLREQIMDCRIAKNEREWWASRHIDSLERQRDELAGLLREAVATMERHVDTRRCAVQSLRTMNQCRALLARIDAEKRP